MIFNFNNQQRVFIHIPKTGGNTIQRTFINNGLTTDKIRIRGLQDGNDRFEITGEFTERKHQSLRKYIDICPELASVNITTCVRMPFERLVSFYFAPFRWAKRDPDTGEIFFPEDVKFSERLFCQLINKCAPGAKFLSTSMNEIIFPTDLTILKTESLDRDIKVEFPGLRISTAINVSPYRNQSKQILQSQYLRRLVEESHHRIDLENFY